MTTAQVCLLLLYGALFGFGVGFGLAVAWCGRRVRRIARSFCRRCGCQRPHTLRAHVWLQHLRLGAWEIQDRASACDLVTPGHGPCIRESGHEGRCAHRDLSDFTHIVRRRGE